MTQWNSLWERRALPPSRGSTLAGLMAADGLDSGFGGVSEAAWSRLVRREASALGLSPDHSVFEVGCGAGAFLYVLERLGLSVGGVDRSATLVAKASQVMPAGSFAVGDAADFGTEPMVDAVISFSVFLYFVSLGYAEQVLTRMVAKARLAVAVLDVPDLAKRDEDLRRRQEIAGGAEAYAARYAGLDHLYYDRDWFAGALCARGLTDVTVEDQLMEGSSNASFRFNVRGFVR